MAFLHTAALLGSLAASAYAHGRVTSISVGGEEYTGFLNEYLYTDSPPDIVAWSADNGDNGFVDGSSYTSGDIICHREAAPGKITAKVAAGSKVDIQWGPDAWPESHHGPVIDYLAKCAGDDCTTVDKETLEFFKIDEAGLIDGSSAPGSWASDELIANDGKWTVTIPESLAPGQYVLRHEIIALHSAGDTNGAQNYPQCFNLEVTGSGSASPEGVLGTALYTPEDAGIKIGIYSPLGDSYEIPGPALWDGASSGSSGSTGSTGNSTSGTAAPSDAPYNNSTMTTSSSTAAATTFSTVTRAASTSAAAASSSVAASSAAESSYSSAAVTSATAATKVADSAPASVSTSASAPDSSDSSASESSESSDGDDEEDDNMPSKPLPEGFTLEDLLAWVDYLLTKGWN